MDKKDVDERKLPKNTMGVLITQIDRDSPINYLNVENIIIEADGKKIKTPGDLKNIVDTSISVASPNVVSYLMSAKEKLSLEKKMKEQKDE